MPLILTLDFDETSFLFFDRLRREYFPPARNFLAAHITLFHNLPETEVEEIENDLLKISAEFAEFPLEFTSWRFLGKGSAMQIESPHLLQLRNALAKKWAVWLKPQDRQKFQPHITVQNKVEPPEARRLFEKLSAGWTPRTGSAEGLSLWHYENPRWRLHKSFDFPAS